MRTILSLPVVLVAVVCALPFVALGIAIRFVYASVCIGMALLDEAVEKMR